MVTTIGRALAQVKDELPQLIAQPVNDYLNQHPGLLCRQRRLDPFRLIQLFVIQVLHGNTAINHLRHLANMSVTATAYCQARMRLPLSLVEYINTWITARLIDAARQTCRWRGHRVWRGDGTSFSMPDTPALQKYFGQPGGQAAGCGFPVATTLVLCNAAGFIIKTLALPLRTHEASRLSRLYDQLDAGDVVVYDRAGCSFVQLALLSMRHMHGILRMHQKQTASFRPGRKHAGQLPKHRRKGVPKSQWLRRIGKHDQLVRWFKPKQRPKWMTWQDYNALPESLILRELRYAAKRKGFRSRSVTLVTTLVDSQKYPAAELAEQYLGRWEIETNFRHLKQTMGMEVLKCKTVDGVLKELAIFTLVYNLVRLVMLRAAERQQVAVDRISFLDALRWLRDYEGGELIDLIVNPKRVDRVEPRAVKRRPKQYPRMTRPRQELRQHMIKQRLDA